MTRVKAQMIVAAAFVAAGGLCGCSGEDGPEMGNVYGTVRLDGKPLPNASLVFVPDGGSPSMGVTDADGQYELQYSSSKNGATVGRHMVRISTYRSGGEDDDGNEIPPAPEKVPAQYNVNSTLVKDVKPGSNEINFVLESDGEIVQRQSDDED